MVIKKQLKDGDEGVADTIEIMRDFAIKYKNDARVQRIVKDIDAVISDKHDSGSFEWHIERLKNLYMHVVNTMTYKSDPQWAELVMSVKHTLFGSKPYGDCDDLSVAAATLFLGAGYKAAYKTIAWRNSDEKKRFTHVYLLVQAKGVWFPMDPTMGEKGFGNEIRTVVRRKEWIV